MKNPFYIEPKKPDRPILKAFWYVLIILILGFIMLLSGGCLVQKRMTEKTYIAVEVSEDINRTYYTFINLSYTEGCRFSEPDTAKCNPGDTVPIQKYRGGLFRRKRIVFILK